MTSTWCTNHQHLIRSPQRCRVHLLLSQSSHAEYLGLSVLSAASVQPVVDCTTEQLLAEAGPERAWQLVCEFVAEAGQCGFELAQVGRCAALAAHHTRRKAHEAVRG